MEEQNRYGLEEKLFESMCNKETVSQVESIFHQSLKQLAGMHYLSNKLSLQKPIGKTKLDETLTEIKGHVDEFLGVKKVKECEIRYAINASEPIKKLALAILPVATILGITNSGTSYNLAEIFPMTALNVGSGLIGAFFGFEFVSSAMGFMDSRDAPYYGPNEGCEGTVVIKKESRTLQIPTIAHEYTHHVQNSVRGSFTMLAEGIARGVERHIAKMYAEKEDNPSFLYDSTMTTTRELGTGYINLCKAIGIPYKKALIESANSMLNEDCDRGFDHYAFGVTYLSVEEANTGKSIYGRAL